MATPYTECYDSFLSHIDDIELLYPYENEKDYEFEERLDDTLYMLFKSAIPKFRFSKTKLTRDDTMQTFINDLRPLEIEIIGLLMLKEYYRKKLNFLVQLKHSFSDKDWKSNDKSNQMNQYRHLLLEVDDEIQELTINNSYTTDDGSLDIWQNE
jgi:hypothetical protein